MFPDSGTAAANAKNTLPDPQVNTAGCPKLWYDTSRCAPRFDPAAANAMLAEDINLLMKAELQYDCANLNHIERAVRYLIQRGLPCGAYLQNGPFDYACALDPPLTRYNDYLTLIVIPGLTNQGPVRINVDGHGLVPLLRNDAQQLQSADLKANIPALISYWSGNWYHVGLVASQVPIVLVGGVDLWIRTDGNDNTGDGSVNDPAKAFRTIRGAWLKAGSRYAATPLFSMNFRFGIPGTYEGAGIGPFGGAVTYTGDIANPGGYRLSSVDAGNNTWVNIHCQDMASVQFRGLTFVRDVTGFSHRCISAGSSNVSIYGANFDSQVANTGSVLVRMSGGTFKTTNGDFYFEGRGLAIGQLFQARDGAIFAIGGNNNSALPIPRFFFNDLPAQVSYVSTSLSVFNQSDPSSGQIFLNNCTGAYYSVDQNSILTGGGVPFPGNAAGAVATGGQVIP
jgi:hypothetical protein